MGVGTVGGHTCSVSIMGYTGPLVCGDGLESDGSRALTKGLILLVDHDGALFSQCLRYGDSDTSKQKSRTHILGCLLQSSILHAAVYRGLSLGFVLVSCCHCYQITSNLNGLKQHACIVLQFWRLESEMSLS